MAVDYHWNGCAGWTDTLKGVPGSRALPAEVFERAPEPIAALWNTSTIARLSAVNATCALVASVSLRSMPGLSTPLLPNAQPSSSASMAPVPSLTVDDWR